MQTSFSAGLREIAKASWRQMYCLGKLALFGYFAPESGMEGGPRLREAWEPSGWILVGGPSYGGDLLYTARSQ